MEDHIRHFARAVMFGTLAGSGFFLLFSVPIGVTGILVDPLGALFIALFPILVCGAFVLPSMILVGLPTTAILHHIGDEDCKTYALAGGVTGLIIPIIVDGVWGMLGGTSIVLAIFGIISGTTAGYVWGGWREKLADTRQAWLEFEDEPAPAPRPKREKWLS